MADYQKPTSYPPQTKEGITVATTPIQQSYPQQPMPGYVVSPQTGYTMKPGPIQPVAVHCTPPSGPPQAWQHGLFDCFADWKVCLLGLYFPCVLYSRTHHRMRTTPSTLKDFSHCNSSCMGNWCSGGVGQVRQRNEIRYRYNLQGSGCNDWAKHYYCAPCALCQEELEVRDRERQNVQMYNAYAQQQPMTYAQQ